MAHSAPEDPAFPKWLEVAPVVGAVALGVAVGMQRNFAVSAVATVAVITAFTVGDCLGVLPKRAATVAVLGGTYLLLRSADPADVAPFYLVGLAAAAVTSTSRRASAITTAAGVAVLVVAWGGRAETRWAMVIWVFGIALGYLGGAGIRVQAELAAALGAAQEGLRRAAAEEERQRIAREVHDVIAHSLTVTMLHLTGARLSLECGDAAEAAAALREAERLGLQSLGDVRRVVGVLGAPQATAMPQPTAANIPTLIEDYRAAGLEVATSITGDLHAVSPAAGLGLYRIIQEALANVGRHGAEARAVVEIHIDGATAQVVVRNVVAVPVRPQAYGGGDGGGHGVAGMAARAEALGGSCSAGPVDGGAWEVRVSIPVGGP